MTTQNIILHPVQTKKKLADCFVVGRIHLISFESWGDTDIFYEHLPKYKNGWPIRNFFLSFVFTSQMAQVVRRLLLVREVWGSDPKSITSLTLC